MIRRSAGTPAPTTASRRATALPTTADTPGTAGTPTATEGPVRPSGCAPTGSRRRLHRRPHPPAHRRRATRARERSGRRVPRHEGGVPPWTTRTDGRRSGVPTAATRPRCTGPPTPADARRRPLSRVTAPGQRHDTTACAPVMAGIRVRRPGGVGRPRTRATHILGDKAYSSHANRAYLRRRKIRAVIPERADQAHNRKARGSRGGRPPACDAELYTLRTVAERSINKRK
ncbi:transposase [Frankia sp. Cj5]|uniref:transposase n=1 Tax=Frankia sp. Cj5 TaxID=2880978 RepID=UPI0021052FD4|nr:transposase [Frankia sp. Cj5]